MPRTLKTFVTNLGFFELAIAAPTMKAALAAWGLRQNAFKHGFARQTDDPKIIAAAEAVPGAVLRRPIGSTGPFKEDADLPKVTAAAMTAAKKAPAPKTAKPAKPPKRRLTPEIKAKPKASVVDLEKARRAREKKEQQDAKEREREEAQAERELAKKDRAVQKAKDALSAARTRHEDALAEIRQRRATLDAQEDKENDRWEKERHRLEAELFKAKR
jgi:colicin import membrane protein